MSEQKKRRPCEIAAEIVAAFLHGPRNRPSLYDFVGVHREKDYLEKYIRQFKESGVLYVEQYDERGSEVIALQPRPFEMKDADPPPKELGRRIRAEARRREPMTFAFQGQMLTISALAAMAGTGYACMWKRLERGMTAEAAVAMGKTHCPWPKKKRGAQTAPRKKASNRFDSMAAYMASRGIV